MRRVSFELSSPPNALSRCFQSPSSHQGAFCPALMLLFLFPHSLHSLPPYPPTPRLNRLLCSPYMYWTGSPLCCTTMVPLSGFLSVYSRMRGRCLGLPFMVEFIRKTNTELNSCCFSSFKAFWDWFFLIHWSVSPFIGFISMISCRTLNFLARFLGHVAWVWELWCEIVTLERLGATWKTIDGRQGAFSWRKDKNVLQTEKNKGNWALQNKWYGCLWMRDKPQKVEVEMKDAPRPWAGTGCRVTEFMPV